MKNPRILRGFFVMLLLYACYGFVMLMLSFWQAYINYLLTRC